MTNKIEFTNGGTWSCGKGCFHADLKAIRLLRECFGDDWEQRIFFSDSNFKLIDNELYGHVDKEEGGIWGKSSDYGAEAYYNAEHHNNDVFKELQSWEAAKNFIKSVNDNTTHGTTELLMSILDIEKKLEVADSVSLPFVGLEELETFLTNEGWGIVFEDSYDYNLLYSVQKDNKTYSLDFDYYEGSILMYKKIERTA